MNKKWFLALRYQVIVIVFSFSFHFRLPNDQFCVQRIPTSFTKSSVHLLGRLTTLHFPLRSRNSRTFLLIGYLLCHAHCHLNFAIFQILIPTDYIIWYKSNKSRKLILTFSRINEWRVESDVVDHGPNLFEFQLGAIKSLALFHGHERIETDDLFSQNKYWVCSDLRVYLWIRSQHQHDLDIKKKQNIFYKSIKPHEVKFQLIFGFKCTFSSNYKYYY